MFENIIDPVWDAIMYPFGLVNDHVLGAVGYSCGFESTPAPARARTVQQARTPAGMGVPQRRGVPSQRVTIPQTRGALPPTRGALPQTRGAVVPRTGFVRYMRG